jgi:hypothetical protein
MPIIKSGFRPGFRGRMKPPACNQRMHYLASEHDRDSACLVGPGGRELSPQQAIEALGGPKAQFHEIIVAPSEEECAAIRARNPDSPYQAVKEAGERMAKAYANGRPYVLAVHEQDGRFHFHLAVAGPMPMRALGRHGQIQRTWDREVNGDEPRIQDWAAHCRFKEERDRLRQIIREQKENENQRRDAIKRASPDLKSKVARPFEIRARRLVERRYESEMRAVQARYEARGSLGSARHKAEIEQVEHRRTASTRRLERREMARALGSAKARIGRAIDLGGRLAQRGTRITSRFTRTSLDLAMIGLGVPRPIRQVARAGLVLAQEATQAALRASLEAAKAAARSSVHLAQASAKLGVGLVGAVPTGGASLQGIGKEVRQELAQAGKELGQGAIRAGNRLAQGAVHTAKAGGQMLVPHDIRAVTRIATASGLSESIKRAFQAAGWIPTVGLATRAAQVAAETAHSIANATTRGPEVDR